MQAHLFGRLTPALAARRRLLEAVRPIERTEEIAVERAAGRVAAETVRAPAAVPGFARADWDGYAIRSADVRSARADRPVSLRVVGEVFAESRFRGRLRPGEAVAIATGGALPRGSDSVVIFEESERSGATVRMYAPARPGDRVAAVGSDIARGETLVRPGTLLGPALLGAIAATGRGSVRAFARPIVTVLPNGTELRSPGARLRAGEIYESNNASLVAAIAACGAEPRPLAPVPDDPRALERALRAALAASDLVVATGGSSVGERDHLPRLFPKIGRLLFHGIAVRPGKPTLAATAGRKVLLGLPGHPSSCLLNMFWLGAPALRRLARQPGPGWTSRRARVVRAIPPPGQGLARVVPLRRLGDRVWPTWRGSAAITSLTAATAFALLPAGAPGIRAGGTLTVFALEPGLAASPNV